MCSSDGEYETHVDDSDMSDSAGCQQESKVDSANNDPQQLTTFMEPLGLEQDVVPGCSASQLLAKGAVEEMVSQIPIAESRGHSCIMLG